MVDTKKFSEFVDGGELANNDITVGLRNGNTKFTNSLPMLPPGTTAERPAVPDANVNFRLRFNTTDYNYEFYNSSTAAWEALTTASAPSTILALLASHLAGEGASLIGLENQGTIVDKTVQDLANTSLIAKVNTGTLVNGFYLASLASGILRVATTTGDLTSLIFQGTTNEIDVANGDGSANPVFSFSLTANMPGTFNIQSTTAVDGIINDSTMVAATATNLSTSLAIKTYVDDNVDRFRFLNPTRVATTGNFASTYDNGTAGIGATLTASSNGAASIDSVSLALADRVLFKDQTNTFENGIYEVTQVGDGSTPAIYTRTTDFDAPDEMIEGEIATVTEGTVNANTGWLLSTTVTVVGTDPIIWISFIPNINNVVTINGTQTITGNKTFNGTVDFGLTDGQLLIGETGNPVNAGSIVAGTGMSVNYNNPNIEISSTGGGLTWTTDATGTIAAAVDNGYVCSNAGATTITLPATCAVGQKVEIEGLGAGGWILTANSGQTIQIGSSTTTTGGTLTSAAATDNIKVVCIVANTTWRVQRTNSAGLTIA